MQFRRQDRASESTAVDQRASTGRKLQSSPTPILLDTGFGGKKHESLRPLETRSRRWTSRFQASGTGSEPSPRDALFSALRRRCGQSPPCENMGDGRWRFSHDRVSSQSYRPLPEGHSSGKCDPPAEDFILSRTIEEFQGFG